MSDSINEQITRRRQAATAAAAALAAPAPVFDVAESIDVKGTPRQKYDGTFSLDTEVPFVNGQPHYVAKPPPQGDATHLYMAPSANCWLLKQGFTPNENAALGYLPPPATPPAAQSVAGPAVGVSNWQFCQAAVERADAGWVTFELHITAGEKCAGDSISEAYSAHAADHNRKVAAARAAAEAWTTIDYVLAVTAVVGPVVFCLLVYCMWHHALADNEKKTIANFLAKTRLLPRFVDENFGQLTAGLPCLVKFYAPWCGHCKAMKPAYDALMLQYSTSETALVAEADCTGEARSTCEKYEVQSFPSIKWGSVEFGMQDYTGARSLSALQAFAEKNLKPLCTPTNKETCSAAELSELQRAVTMSDEELDAAIQTKEAAIQAAGALFTKKSDELRKREVALAEAHKAALAALQHGDTPLKDLKRARASRKRVTKSG